MKPKVLTVIIPCYNEKNTIEEIVDKVIASPLKNKEIIIVDNVSTDGTRDILKNKIEKKVSKVIYNEKNIGKSGSLKVGFKVATGDAVIVQDADLEYDPNEYPMLVEPIFSEEYKVVYGSRFATKVKKGYLANYIANRTLTFLSNIFTHQHLTDMETCYKAFDRELIQAIKLDQGGFGFEPEITSKISKLGLEIKEIPISYYPREYSGGKKVKFKDGIHTIMCILKYR